MYSFNASAKSGSQMEAHYAAAHVDPHHVASIGAGMTGSIHHPGKQMAFQMAGQHMTAAGVNNTASFRLKQQQQQQQQQHHHHHFAGYSNCQNGPPSVHPAAAASMLETVTAPQRLVSGGISQGVPVHSKALHRLAAGGQMIHSSSSQRAGINPHYSSASQMACVDGIKQGMPTYSSTASQRVDAGGMNHMMPGLSSHSQMMHGANSGYVMPSTFPKQFQQHQAPLMQNVTSTHCDTGVTFANTSSSSLQMPHAGSIQTGFPKTLVSQSGVKLPPRNNDASYTQVGKINAGLLVSPAVPYTVHASPPHSYAQSAHSVNALQAGSLRLSRAENAILQERAACRSKCYTSMPTENRSVESGNYKNNYSASRTNMVRSSHQSDYPYVAKSGSYSSEKHPLHPRTVMVNDSVGQRVNIPMSLSPISPADEDPPSPQFDASLVSPASSVEGGHMRLGVSDRSGAVKTSTGAMVLSRSQYDILHADMAQGRGRIGSIQTGFPLGQCAPYPRGFRTSAPGGSVAVKGAPSQRVPPALASPIHQSPSVSPYASMMPLRTETQNQKQKDKAYVVHPAASGSEAAPIDLSGLGKNSSAREAEIPLDLSVKTTKRPADVSDLSDQRPSSAKRLRQMNAPTHESPVLYSKELGKMLTSGVPPNCDMRYPKQQLVYSSNLTSQCVDMQQSIQQANRKMDTYVKLESSQDRTLKDNGPLCNSTIKAAPDIRSVKTHSDMIQAMSFTNYHLAHSDRATEHKPRSDLVEKESSQQCFKMSGPMPLQPMASHNTTGQVGHALDTAQKPHLIKSDVHPNSCETNGGQISQNGSIAMPAWQTGAQVSSYQPHIHSELIDPPKPQNLQPSQTKNYSPKIDTKSFVTFQSAKESAEQCNSIQKELEHSPLLHSAKTENRTSDGSAESSVVKDEISDSGGVISYEMRLPVDSGHIVNVSNTQLNSILVPKPSAIPCKDSPHPLPSSKPKPRLLDSLPVKVDHSSSGGSDGSETEAENGEQPEKDLFKFAQPLSIAIPSSKSEHLRKSVQQPAPKIWSRKQIILNQFNQDEDMKRKVYAAPVPVGVHRVTDHIFKTPNISPASPSSPKMPILSPHDKLPLPENSSLNNDPPTLDLPDTPDKKAAARAAEGRVVDRTGSKTVVKDKAAIRVANSPAVKEDQTSIKNTNERYARRHSLPDGPLMYQKNIPVANVAPFVHSERVDTPIVNQMLDSVIPGETTVSEIISQLEEVKDIEEAETVESKQENAVTTPPKQKTSNTNNTNLTSAAKKVVQKKRNKMSVSKATLRDLKKTESQLKSEQLRKVAKHVTNKSVSHLKSEQLRKVAKHISDKSVSQLKSEQLRKVAKQVSEKSVSHLKSEQLRKVAKHISDKTVSHLKSEQMRKVAKHISDKTVSHLKSEQMRKVAKHISDKTVSQLKSEQMRKVAKHISDKRVSSPNSRLVTKQEVRNATSQILKQNSSRLRKSSRHSPPKIVKRSLTLKQRSRRLSQMKLKQQSEGDDTVESASDSEPQCEGKNIRKVTPDHRLVAKERTMRKAVIQVNRLEDTFDVSALQSANKGIKSVSNLNKRAQELKQRAIDGPGKCGSQRRQCRRLSQSSHTRDLQPKVWEMTTRNKLAGRRRVVKYNRNAAYEKELKREESRKAMNRAKRRACMRGKTLETEEKHLATKFVPEDDDSDSEGRWEITKSQDDLRQTLRSGRNKGGLMMKLYWRHPVGNEHPAMEDQSEKDEMMEPRGLRKRLLMTKKQMRAMAKRRRNRSILGQFCDDPQLRQQYQQFPGYMDDGNQDDELQLLMPQDDYETDITSASEYSGSLNVSNFIPVPPEFKKLSINKNSGETMLHRAARLGYVDIALYCLRTSAVDVNARDNAGYTPLHESCVRGDLVVARELVTHGGNVNCCSQDGIRPIHDAVENDHIQIVRLLLSWGADPLLATYGGKTPLKIARSFAMLQLLKGYLGDLNGFEPDEDRITTETFWEFQGSSDFLDSTVCQGFDVFADVPSDPEDEDDFEMFDISETSSLCTYDLPLDDTPTSERCFVLVDVLQHLKVSRHEFDKLDRAESATIKLSREAFVQSLTTCAVQIPKLKSSFIELMTMDDFLNLGSTPLKPNKKDLRPCSTTHSVKKTKDSNQDHSSVQCFQGVRQQWPAKSSECPKKFVKLSLDRTKDTGKNVKRFPSNFQRRSQDKFVSKTTSVADVSVSDVKSEEGVNVSMCSEVKGDENETNICDKLKKSLGCEKSLSDKWKVTKKETLQKKSKKHKIRKDKCISKWLIRKRHTSQKKKKYPKQLVLPNVPVALGDKTPEIVDSVLCDTEGQSSAETSCNISPEKHQNSSVDMPSSCSKLQTSSDMDSRLTSKVRNISKNSSGKPSKLSRIGKVCSTTHSARGKDGFISGRAQEKAGTGLGGTPGKACVTQGGAKGKDCVTPFVAQSKACVTSTGTPGKSFAALGGVQDKVSFTPSGARGKFFPSPSGKSSVGSHGKTCVAPSGSQEKVSSIAGVSQGKSSDSLGDHQGKAGATNGGAQGKTSGVTGTSKHTDNSSKGKTTLPLKSEQLSLQKPNIYSFEEDDSNCDMVKMPRMKREQEHRASKMKKQSEQLYCFDDDSADEEITFRKMDYKHVQKPFKSNSSITSSKLYSQSSLKKGESRDMLKRNNNT